MTTVTMWRNRPDYEQTREIAPYVQITLKITEDLSVSYTANVWNKTRTDIITGGQLQDDIYDYIDSMTEENIAKLHTVLANWQQYHLRNCQDLVCARALIINFESLPDLPIVDPLADITISNQLVRKDKGSTFWKVTLSYQGRKADFNYSMGSAHKDDPKLPNVISSLQMDMGFVDYSVEEIKSELGFTNAQAAKSVAQSLKEGHKKLRYLFGEDYDKFFVYYR